jgi:hypothetical protein
MSLEITPVNRNKFYAAIKKAFKCKKNMTARECSEKLYNMGIIEYPTRSFVHPRITEMLQMGMLEENGRKIDNKTHKLVTIYKLKEEN